MDIFLNSALKLFAFIFAITLSILIHELFHFLVARRLGVQVSSFSIGFGKPLCKWHDKFGTTYILAPILLGGYIKMATLQSIEKLPNNNPETLFDKKPIPTRLAIILAGSIGNFILALFLFWLTSINVMQFPKAIIGYINPNSQIANAKLHSGDEIIKLNDHTINNWSDMYMQILPYLGENNKFALTISRSTESASMSKQEINNHKTKTSNHQTFKTPAIFSLDYDKKVDFYQIDIMKDLLGIKPYYPISPAIISSVEKHGPAAKFGLQKNDKIIAISNHPIKNWDDYLEIIQKYPDQTFPITIQRNNKNVQFNINSSWRFNENWQKIGYLGIKPILAKWPENKISITKYGALTAIPHALKLTYDFIQLNVLFCKKLITGKISLHMIGGPFMIFQSTASALQQGFLIYLRFIAILNTTLIIANILPIPGLDGGCCIFLAIEAIRKKPLALNTQMLCYRLGMILLILLMAQAVINDLIRICT